MSQPVKQTTLYFKSGNSDKVYQAAIVPEGGLYSVNFAYGRRGASLTAGSKTPTPVSLDKAEEIYNKLLNEKKSKGYTEGEDGTPYVATRDEDRVTGVIPQLLNAIDEDEVERRLADDAFGAQEKFDGKHLLVRVDGKTVTAINKRGLECGFPETIGECARKLAEIVERLRIGPPQLLIDGEAIGERLVAYDLLEVGETDLRPAACRARHEMLTKIRGHLGIGNFPVWVAPFHKEPSAKRSLYEALQKLNREGIVFKRLDAPYVPGRPNSGGDMLKHKFTATASFIVSGINDRRSIAISLYRDDQMVSLGNCPVPVNMDFPKEGEIVEVRYLYAYRDGGLAQPCLLGLRSDVDAGECRVDQLKYKSEED